MNSLSNAAKGTMKKSASLIVLSYAAIYLIWGSTYFFIKMSAESIPELLAVGYRWGISGAVFILGAYCIRSKRRYALKDIAHSSVIGALLILIPNVLVTHISKKVDSYLVSLLIVMTPVAAAFFDWLLFRKKITMISGIGIACGMSGVAFLLYNGFSLAHISAVHGAMMGVAVISIGLGISLGQKLNRDKDLTLHAGFQMFLSGVGALMVAGFIMPEKMFAVNVFSARSLFALLYLMSFGSVGYLAYSYLIRHEPVVRVTSHVLVNPVIAVCIGMVIGGEAPIRHLFLSVPLVLVGVSLMLYGEKLGAFMQGKKYLNRRPLQAVETTK